MGVCARDTLRQLSSGGVSWDGRRVDDPGREAWARRSFHGCASERHQGRAQEVANDTGKVAVVRELEVDVALFLLVARMSGAD